MIEVDTFKGKKIHYCKTTLRTRVSVPVKKSPYSWYSQIASWTVLRKSL